MVRRHARPAVTRARAVGTDHAFKQERDEEALRALFPSNYPAVA
jgi:GST-like protein